jgi:hypothetical protein
LSEPAGGHLIQLTTSPRVPAIAGRPGDRARLERQARLLAWGGIAWHFVEFGIALAAGIAAGSIALIGFGADSLVEALAASSSSGCSPAAASDPSVRSAARSN